MMPCLKTSKRRIPRWLLVTAIILVVCIVVIAVMTTLVCKDWLANKAADVHVVGISLQSISLTTITANVTLSVHNSSPISAILHRVAYDIYFEEDGNWVHLGSADRSGDTTIKANSSTRIDVINEIGTFSAAGALYQAYKQGGSINLKVVGSAWVRIGPITMEIPFQRIEKIGF
jgi:LEA14-like dessication related protein